MSNLVGSLYLLGPELVLATGAMLLLLIGVFRGDRSFVALTWVSCALYLGAGRSPDRPRARWRTPPGVRRAVARRRFRDFPEGHHPRRRAVASLLALPYLKRARTARFEYPVIVMLAALGTLVMVSANNLITLYLGLELAALAQYVLAAFHRNEARSSEAGLKYFVLGSLSSGILLFGISLVYGFAGSTAFPAIHAALTGAIAIGPLIGVVLVLVGLAFKVAAVPFHMWTPDVYEGAPTPVAAFFASAPKVAAMGLLVRVAVVPFGGCDR